MNFFCTPKIPNALMHTMFSVEIVSEFSQEKGGQYIQKEGEKIPFSGVVLPISDKDLIRDVQGNFTQFSEKIYTNGFALKVGGKVFDPQTNKTYTVTQELSHNSLHPMKRYVVESKG